MDQIRKEFQKRNLVIRRQKNGMSKAAATGKYISSFQPEAWLSSFIFFVVNSLPSGGAGKTKKVLRKLMSEQLSPEGWNELEPLFESFLEELQNEATLMEDEGGGLDLHGLKILIDVEPEILKLMEMVEGFDSPDGGPLTLAKLNGSLHEAVPSVQKDVGSKGITIKEARIKRFFTFFNLFEKRLVELGITDDEKIAKFLISLTKILPRIKIKNKDRENGKK